MTSELTKSFWDHYLNNEEDARNKYASPIRADDLSELPPALLITAQYDPIRDDGETSGACLHVSEMHRYDGLIHGFIQLPIPINEKIFQTIGQFLNKRTSSVSTKQCILAKCLCKNRHESSWTDDYFLRASLDT